MTRNAAPLPGMIGDHPLMREVYRRVRAVAPGDIAITVIGESGTGKELVARAVHDLSGMRDGPFIAVNCAALPEGLAEAELFGCERGAFTGALQRSGLLEGADGGTLFLDEVCSMPISVQAKMLRAIEHHRFFRVGGRDERASSFRVVSAVSEPIPALMAGGRLRRDFAYRVAGVQIALPPLRERSSDIPRLAAHFLEACGGAHRSLSPDAVEFLVRQRWRGNVRELRSVIESASLLAHDGALCARDLLDVVGDGAAVAGGRSHLRALLETNGWNVTQTARSLGVARSTLYVWLAEQGIRRPGRDGGPPSDRTDRVSDRTVALRRAAS